MKIGYVRIGVDDFHPRVMGEQRVDGSYPTWFTHDNGGLWGFFTADDLLTMANRLLAVREDMLGETTEGHLTPGHEHRRLREVGAS